MYCRLVNNRSSLIYHKNSLFKHVTSTVISSFLVIFANCVYADVNGLSSKGIDNLFESREFLNTLKKNEADVLKTGRARFVIDSNQFNIFKEDLHTHAVEVIDNLQLAGFEAYLVGGAVRDLLSGKEPKDYDVCTSASADEVVNLFKDKNARKVGKNYPIVKLDYKDEEVEVAPFKSGSLKNDPTAATSLEKADGAEETSALAQDSDRRDLTINAIYFDINKAQFIDFHGGIYDLREHVINTIGDAATIYKQDPLRMLRVIRFAAKLNFKISDAASKPIYELVPYLKKIHQLRMFAEVNNLFLTGYGSQTLNLLCEYDAFKYVFPDLENKIKDPQYKPFFEHVVALFDAEHSKRNFVKPYLIYAYMLWPAFLDKVNYLKKSFPEYTDDQIADWAWNKILTVQNKSTALRSTIPDDILYLWKLQSQLLKIDDLSVVEALSADPNFINAFELLRMRETSGENVEKYVKFWLPYFDEKSVLYPKKR